MEIGATCGYLWADLNSELLVSIATTVDGLSLRDYNCLRGVCTAWRSALLPPYPCILSLADNPVSAYPSSLDTYTDHLLSTGVRNFPCVAASGKGGGFVFSLPLGRSFPLGMAMPSTMDGRHDDRPSMDSSIIELKTNTFSTESHSHICTRFVGSGNGRFAVSIDHGKERQWPDDRITYSFWTARILLLCPRTGKEVKLVPLPMKGYECVRKIVFAPDPDDGTVVAMWNGKKIAYIDTSSGDDMKWTVIDDVLDYTEYLVDLVFDDGGGKVYCLDTSGSVRVLLIPRGGRNKQDDPAAAALVSVPGSAAFPPPYDIISEFAFTKHLFFCHGSLYQMWQYTSATFILSNRFPLSTDQIFVLRYDPRHCPCWNTVKELGGCSVFLGKNGSPTVVRPAGGAVIPGVRPDCVYWIDRQRGPMVCDVVTGTSKPCVDLPYGAIRGSTCWYFDDA